MNSFVENRLNTYSVNLVNWNEEIENHTIAPVQEACAIAIQSEKSAKDKEDDSNKSTKPTCRKAYERFRTETEQVDAQKMKHPMVSIHDHNCRLNCGKKFSEDSRTAIYNEYWSLGKTRRMWMNKFIEIMNVKSKLTNRTRNRESTIQYYLPTVTNNRENVCQKFFLATLGYQHNSIVMTFIKAKTDDSGKQLVEPKMDMRGKREPGNKKDLSTIIEHVNTYNPVPCKYSADKMYLPITLNVKEMYKNFCQYYPNLLCYEVYRKQVRRMNIIFGNPQDYTKNTLNIINQPAIEYDEDKSNSDYQENIVVLEIMKKQPATHLADTFDIAEPEINVVDTDEHLISKAETNQTKPRIVLPSKKLKKPRRRCRYFDSELKLKHPLVPMIDHKCRWMCNDKFNEQSRQRIYDEYWSLELEKRIWLNKYIQICEVKTRLISSKKVRANSFHYDLPNENGTTKRVCQKFFLGTLGYTHSSIISTFVKAKKDQFGRPLNIPKLDMRGKHTPKNKKNRMVILDHIHTFLPLKGLNSQWFYLSPKLSVMDMFKDFCLYHSGKMSYEVYRAVVKKLNFIFLDPEEETELATMEDLINVICPKIPPESLIITQSNANININDKGSKKEFHINNSNEEALTEEQINNLKNDECFNAVEFLHVPDANINLNSVSPNLDRKNRIAAMKSKHEQYTIAGVCCRLNCNKKFSDDLRKPIHDNFWSFDNNERRLWINNYVKVVPVKRRHRNAKTNRQNSATYSLPFVYGIFSKVCQRFFLSTLGYANSSIIASFIRAKVSKSGERLDVPRIDMRGRRTPNNKIDRTIIVEHIESIRTKENLSIKEMFADFKQKHRIKISYELYRLEVQKLRNSLVEPTIHINPEIVENDVLKEQPQLQIDLIIDEYDDLIKLNSELTQRSNKEDQCLEVLTNSRNSKNENANGEKVSINNAYPILSISGKICCRNKCNLLFTNEIRSNINHDFWLLSNGDQRLWLDCFIHKLVKNKNKPSRKTSVEYHLPQLGGRSVCVCRKFFFATLGGFLKSTVNDILKNKLKTKLPNKLNTNKVDVASNTDIHTKQISDEKNHETEFRVTTRTNKYKNNDYDLKSEKILFEPAIRVPSISNEQTEPGISNEATVLAKLRTAEDNDIGDFEFFDYSGNNEAGHQKRSSKVGGFISVVNHSCRQNCILFSIEVRKAIYEQYWNLDRIAQQNWLGKHIQSTEIKRRLCNRKTNRVNSLIYELPLNESKLERVCQKFFLSTLGYSTTSLISAFLRTHFDRNGKKLDTPKIDMRGKRSSTRTNLPL